MTSHNETYLFNLIDKAEQLAGDFQGGYSGHFFSAEEFHQELLLSIEKLKKGDKTQIEKLNIWFLPTSCCDDFIGEEGQNLADDISELLSKLVNA